MKDEFYVSEEEIEKTYSASDIPWLHFLDRNYYYSYKK
jgi:hypothetical protein